MSEIVCLREPARRTPDVSLALFPACPLAHSGRSYQNARNTIDGHSATPLRRRGDGVSTGLVVVVVAVSVVVIVVADRCRRRLPRSLRYCCRLRLRFHPLLLPDACACACARARECDAA